MHPYRLDAEALAEAVDAGPDGGVTDGGLLDAAPPDGGRCLPSPSLTSRGSAALAQVRVNDVAIFANGEMVVVGEFSGDLSLGGVDTGLTTSGSRELDAFAIRLDADSIDSLCAPPQRRRNGASRCPKNPVG